MKTQPPRTISILLISCFALFSSFPPSVEAFLPSAKLSQKPAQAYIIKQWSREQGAPSSRINDLIQGSDGFLWLATYEGLVRFDGEHFRLFNHQHHPALVGGLLNIVENRPGNFLMVSVNGVLVRLREGIFTAWTDADGFPAERGDRLTVGPNGELVLYGKEGFVFLDEKDDSIKPYPVSGVPDGVPQAFAFDQDGTLWVAPAEGSLLAMRAGLTRNFDLIGLGAPNSRVNQIYPQNDGTLWIGLDGGVALLLPMEPSLRFFPQNAFSHQGRDLRLARQHGSELLGGNTLGSLHTFSQDGIKPFPLDSIHQTTETVNSLTSLSLGGHAIGTYSQGLLLVFPAPFPFFGSDQGLQGLLVNSIRPGDPGELLIAHNLGVDRFDGRNFKPLQIKDQPFRDYTVDLLRDSRSRLWIGTFGNGLFLKNGDQWTHIGRDQGLRSTTIRALAEDRQGTIWIGTREGLHSWKDGAIQFYGEEQGLRSRYILSLFVDPEDRLWIGTARGGLHLLENGSIQLPEDPDEQRFATRTIFAMSTDRLGRTWGGMTGGIFRISGTKVEFLNLYEKMDIDSVFHIVDDGLDSLWLAASNGLHQVPYKLLEGPLHSLPHIGAQAILWNRRDGLPSDAMRPVSRLHRDADNHLWFPTENGFFRLDPARLPRDTVFPEPFFDSIFTNDAIWERPWHLQQAQATFAADLRRIRFDLTAPRFHRMDSVILRHRLLGFDSTWRQTSGRSIEFTNLSPGSYKLEVQSGDGDKLWQTPGAHFAFTIQPAFYQTGWFYVLLFATISIGLVLAHRRRTYVLRQRQAELEKVVAERTRALRENEQRLAQSNEHLRRLNDEKNHFLGIAAHDLRNPIAGVEGIASIMVEEAEAIPSPEIADMGQTIIDSTRRMFALIENLLDLNRIEEGHTIIHKERIAAIHLLAKAREDNLPKASRKNIQIILESQPDSLHEIDVDPAVLGQILDNFVSNAVKFSAPRKSVFLGAEKIADKIRLSVRDEGPGISPREQQMLFQKFAKLSNRPTGGEPSTGLGLSIAKQLTELMGGTIGCQSTPGKGSTFHVEFPLN